MKKVTYLFVLLAGCAFGQTLENDKQALIALYNATGGADWTNNTNWITNADVATWNGVTVSGGRVTELFLFSNNLTGTIPTEIGSLTALTYLDLAANNLQGAIPDEIGNLTALVNLGMDDNEITGSIPPAIGNLVNLTFLGISSCDLSGSIPSEIGNLTKLTALWLADNPSLTGEIPLEIWGLTKLESLLLGNNDHYGNVPAEIGQLINLTDLTLWNNRFTGPIPAEIGQLTKLYQLYLSGNQFEGTVPIEISQLFNLVTLDISINRFVDLPDFVNTPLTNSGKLESFSIYDNYFTFEDLEPNQSIISPPYNQNGFGSYQTFTPELGQPFEIAFSVGGENNEYRWVKDGENISDANTSTLLINSISLDDDGAYWLKVTNSNFPGLTITSAFQLISNGPRFDRLALEALYNATDGPNWVRNTNWLSEEPLDTWYGLSVFDNRVLKMGLFANNLSGTLPEEIQNLTEMFALDLSNNNLQGDISWIGKLKNLSSLDVTQNSLSGELPGDIGNLTELTHLSLGSNHFLGEVPTSIGALSKLTLLNLSNNEFAGSIPEEVFNISNLTWLQLDHNHFDGILPESIGNLINLQFLSLYNNSFTGSIPVQLGQLSKLDYLSMTNNNFSGLIPKELGQLSELTVLSLANNGFVGIIPQELGDLSKLEFLSFANNTLKGSLPIELGEIQSLSFLRVEHNLFDQIPDYSQSAIATSGLLEDFRISDNHFTFEDFEPNLNLITENESQKPFGEAQNIVVENGAVLSISFAIGGAHNLYRWEKNGEVISGAEAKEFTIKNASANDAGEYILNVTNSIVGNLVLKSEPFVIEVKGTDTTTGVTTEVHFENEVDLYPNPTRNKLFLTVKNGKAREDITVEIVDTNGRRVYYKTECSASRFELSTMDLPSGQYILRAYNSNVSFVRKFIRE